jgi:hypothetical protein
MPARTMLGRSRCGALRLTFALVLVGCSKPDERASVTDRDAARLPPAPPAFVSGTPVAVFADAGSIDGRTPLEQARAYEENGQHWLARLVLEQKALGPDGTPAEIELLAGVCHEQGDESCLESCSKKLGRKLKFDAGAGQGASAASGARVHSEPDSDAARARDLLLKNHLVEARKILEPKVLDGKASNEELRLLKTVCGEQADRMCVALCDAKLR